MTSAAEPAGVHPRAVWVWDQVCRHIDGLAIGSTVAALHERGALRAIVAGGPASIGELRRSLGANAGYLQVAIRMLADQGWVTRAGQPGTDALTIEPSPCGRVVMEQFAPWYQLAARFLPVAERIDEVLFGRADRAGLRALASCHYLMSRQWQLPADVLTDRARRQVLAHLSGHLVAPIMSVLARRGFLGPPAESRLPDPAAEGNRDALLHAFAILACQGWAAIDGEKARLTPAGLLAAACARQYWYPVSYLPMIRRVPQLLFGDAAAFWAERAAAEESYVDRALDIRFSGDVFTASCRTPFLGMTLPIFDERPVEAQPTMVVDVGCGDGTLLETLYAEVRARTRRGRCLNDHPLLMVGAEPSPVARRSAAERLHAAGVPHVITDGDITDPDALSLAMGALGLDPADALYVSKSVIHDRTYREPAEEHAAVAPLPVSTGAFAAPDGAAIPPSRIVLSLVALFRSWRRLARRHGFLVIEAHTVDPATAARLIGRTIATAFDATQGYSNQYPVEPDVFYWAARAGGFRSCQHREAGAETVGHTVLTVDHFLVEDSAGPLVLDGN